MRVPRSADGQIPMVGPPFATMRPCERRRAEAFRPPGAFETRNGNRSLPLVTLVTGEFQFQVAASIEAQGHLVEHDLRAGRDHVNLVRVHPEPEDLNEPGRHALLAVAGQGTLSPAWLGRLAFRGCRLLGRGRRVTQNRFIRLRLRSIIEPSFPP